MVPNDLSISVACLILIAKYDRFVVHGAVLPAGIYAP